MPEETIASSKKGIRREDPPPRAVEQTANRGGLLGQDPGKHYVWVSEVNDPTFNVGSYRALGYNIAQYDPDEAKPSFGFEEFKQGDPIRSSGMVLMECSIERKRAHDEAGWAKADAIQDTIKNRELDPLSDQERREFRGITSVRADNDDRKRWAF